MSALCNISAYFSIGFLIDADISVTFEFYTILINQKGGTFYD